MKYYAEKAGIFTSRKSLFLKPDKAKFRMKCFAASCHTSMKAQARVLDNYILEGKILMKIKSNVKAGEWLASPAGH
jgi:hypothetical protein